jgi:phenylalanyl-tRNA synthetase beta chain
MRVPLSWLREFADLPDDLEPQALGAALIRAGLEVERVELTGGDVSGVVVGQVLGFEEELQKNGKTIRWCQVAVGEAEPRGIVCGAGNFAVGDRVPVALPGAVLPGPFPITARKTYGHVSDGMICSARELGTGEDHAGILVLPADTPLGADVVELLGLRDDVLEIAVTPDRSYCLSVRGVAREAATAFGVAFRDPAAVAVPQSQVPGWPVVVEDPAGCDRYTARVVTGIDPAAASPLWLQRRLTLSGMRPVSLVVDVTNHVMLELGQPLHAFDRDQLAGAITVRRARPGERLTTLDGVDRQLDAGELLICDEQGPLALAGVMGGRRAECSPATTAVVLESAHFAPAVVARAARRHKLPSEAARRYERGVDDDLAVRASQVAADLLARLAGATALAAVTDVDARTPRCAITFAVSQPSRLAGRPYSAGVVRARLLDIGAELSGADDALSVLPPSWRPDLEQPADLVEEVLRLEGYDTIPPALPRTVAGHGLTRSQRLRRQVGRALAAAGFVETLAYPFVGAAALDALGLPAGDPRRDTTRLINPISEDEPYLRTFLLPGLLATLVRNIGRGAREVAVSETGLVFGAPAASVTASWTGAPNGEDLAAMDAGLPDQRLHVATALVPLPDTDASGPWWGTGRPPTWAEAVESARIVADAVGVALEVRSGATEPYHPGRCAELWAEGVPVGHAGELHPRVVAALGVPARTSAMEIDLTALLQAPTGVRRAPAISSYPDAGRDVALVVADSVPVAAVASALADSAGPMLESVRLFDVYTGAPVPEGQRSLAFALRFRAADRTLTDEEVNAARDQAVAGATSRTGALLRT